MEITLDALALGKPTSIKNNDYLSTTEYVDWFIKLMTRYTNRFIVKVQLPTQVTLSKDSKDITYNKVWIQAIMPENFDLNGFHEVYGLVYALDVKTPVYKIYKAYINPETNNTVVFNNSWIESYELHPNELLNLNLDNLQAKVCDIFPKLDLLRNRYISSVEEIHELLGKLIDSTIMYDYKYVGGKIKLSTNNIINAYSKTFGDLTKPINYLELYDNICNEINDNKDITNIFEKTILVGMLFDLVENGNNN